MSVAAITGGSRGIGRAIAEALATRGTRVVTGDIDGTADVELDVADPSSFERFLAAAGPVDILVNNAGIMPIGHFLGQDQRTAQRVFDVNVHGVLNGMRAVLPGMIQRGGGHIINIASTAGRVAVPGGVLYCATKHAVVGAGDAVRQEFADRGIKVTTVLPSFKNTDLISGTKGLRGIPNVEPEDVAKAVVRAIDNPQPSVVVPRRLRASLWIHDALPARANDAISKAFGADRAFLDIDHATRHDYDARIR
jgi:NADP-dependent 3-hydroxy acid dehydrogenase YdfG